MVKSLKCSEDMLDSYAIALLAIHMSCDSCKMPPKCFIFHDGPSMFFKTKIHSRIHTLFLNNMKFLFYFFFVVVGGDITGTASFIPFRIQSNILLSL